MRSWSPLAIASVLLAWGCGGSSSETPWPVEPVGPAAAPAGEADPSRPEPSDPAPDPASGAPSARPAAPPR